MKIDKQEAKKLYPEVPPWFQRELEGAFGTECFKKKNFDDIKTFEDACAELDINPQAVYFKDRTPDEIAYIKLKVVAQAINQGWVPDWNNTNQNKWWPWFNLSSGFGFSYSGYGYGRASTSVGSRLCFESKEKSDYAAKQFLGLYKEFLT
jgi:hypothetical protein